jgi:predicted outer membrane repeat protein
VFTPTISVITLTITSPVGINNDNNAYLDLDVVVDQDPGDTTVFTLTIQGSGVKVIRNSSSPPQFEDRIFDILPPGSGAVAGGVRIENLLIETGLAINASEETVPNTQVCYLGGGGVRHRSGGLLEIESGTVSFNFANGNGSGICQDGGQLRVLNYTFIAGNFSQFFSGGGLYISGTAEITATVTQNKVEDDGGGIYVASGSVVTITASDVLHQ